jgi:hypothetical protein
MPHALQNVPPTQPKVITGPRFEREKIAEKKKKELDRQDPITDNGKRMSGCTMDELMATVMMKDQ